MLRDLQGREPIRLPLIGSGSSTNASESSNDQVSTRIFDERNFSSMTPSPNQTPSDSAVLDTGVRDVPSLISESSLSNVTPRHVGNSSFSSGSISMGVFPRSNEESTSEEPDVNPNDIISAGQYSTTNAGIQVDNFSRSRRYQHFNSTIEQDDETNADSNLSSVAMPMLTSPIRIRTSWHGNTFDPFSFLRNAYARFSSFFLATMAANTLTTNQVHTVSILLSCLHFFTLKLISIISNFILGSMQKNMKQERGSLHGDNSTDVYYADRYTSTDMNYASLDSTRKMNAEWFAPENKVEESCSNLDMIMVYEYFLSDTKTKHVSISEQAAMAMPPEERKKPILLHLLVPLCAMSIFFLAAMLLYLLLLVLSQVLHKVLRIVRRHGHDRDLLHPLLNSNLYFYTHSTSIYDSPLQCMMLLSFLPILLDHLLPWISIGIGLYFLCTKTCLIFLAALMASTLVIFHGVSI